MNNPIRIIIVDDHPLIKEGIKQILSFYDDIQIVGEGCNGMEAVTLASQIPCDLLLLDINMPLLNGIEVVRQLKISQQELPILLLTVENDYHTIKEAISLNINGYILKESAGSTLVTAIRQIHSGGHYIDSTLTKTLFTLIQDAPSIALTPVTSPDIPKSETTLISNLSPREKEILSHLSNGLTNKEIGSKLFLSEKTIRNSLTKLFKKLDVKDRTQAKEFALMHHLHLST